VVSEHTEVERKYDVDGDFTLPDLGLPGVAAVDPPVEHQLEAVYHDTPDLRLARARITLRRRTGGADAGWHLKLPGDDGARRELHAPLGRATRTPPGALREPVAGVLRGAATGPVATLRTHRLATVLRAADGRALAEVADDTVTASATGPDGAAELHAWREVEVELVEGDAALLDAAEERLAAAGARPAGRASKLGRVLASRLPSTSPPRGGTQRATAGDVVLAAVRAQVQVLEQADIGLRLGAPDAVHRMRVAARRLRSILAAFGAVLDRGATDPVRAELGWLGGQLGQARDDEVALGHLRALVAAQPPELVLGPVAARLQQAALRSAAEGHERALATLADPRHLRLLDALHDLLDAPPFTGAAADRAGPVLRAAVTDAARRLRRRVRQAGAAGRADAALHEVRKAAKRARYTAEVAAAAKRTGSRRLEAAGTRVHKVLGEVQDTVVTRARARALGIAAAAAGENAFTFGLLHGLEEARGARARAAFTDLEPDLLDRLRAISRR
jgi:CHAD domain-containing protein